jgi:hypothetical protein
MKFPSIRTITLERFLLTACVGSLLFSSLLNAQQPSSYLKKANPQQEAAAAAAKSVTRAALASPSATILCSYTFVSGSGNNYLQYCVTANGNITYLETPFGHAHIGGNAELSSFGEGYGICNESPAQNYYDYAGFGDTGNWGPPTLLSLTATSVKIARSTSDLNWTLTQTITQIAGPNPSIKILMALKNNQAVSKVAYLVRYADVDADAQFLNNFGATQNSAAGWNEHDPATGFSYGLQLQNVGTPHFGYWDAFAQNVPQGPNACAFAFNSPGTVITATDGSVVMAYVGPVPAGGTKTATVSYRGF